MSELVTKAVGIVDAVESDNPNGAFEVILSAPTLDRDKEVIEQRAFDPLPDHVPFDIDHGMTVATTVGSGTPYYAEDGTLRVKGTFASTPLAQEVRTLVSEGHIRTTSVTFMSADREKDEKGVVHVKSAELLNGTFCPVPSNRQAVVLSAKSLAETLRSKVPAAEAELDIPVEDVTPDADVDRQQEDEKSASDAAEDADHKSASPAAEDADQIRSALLSINEDAARFAFGG